MEPIKISTSDTKSYHDVLLERLLDDGTGDEKKCTLEAQGRLINTLVEVVTLFVADHPSIITIANIRIGTIKVIKVQGSKAKNTSWMRIILVREPGMVSSPSI
ncbi:hypothetical protein GF325_02825 [Candidatus Bathyarchaeota archaeon]|nr:hypothetical protein [Candidatus Bathyarchaeota archaeon]